MSGPYVRIPKAYFQELQDLVIRIGREAADENHEPSPVDRIIPPVPSLWIDPVKGHNGNSGMDQSCPVQSWGAVTNRLKPGMCVNLLPGAYTQLLLLQGQSEITVKAVGEPGSVVFSNLTCFEGEWQYHGNGVYKIEVGDFDTPGLVEGVWGDTQLVPYPSFPAMQAKKISGLSMPKEGFCVEGSMLYVRLPGNADPNEAPPSFLEGNGKTFVHVRDSKCALFQGILFEGTGKKPAVLIDQKSSDIVFDLCAVDVGTLTVNAQKEHVGISIHTKRIQELEGRICLMNAIGEDAHQLAKEILGGL